MRKFINIIALALLFASCSLKAKDAETTINVIPYPQSVEVGKGRFKGAGANFNCDQAIDAKSQEIIKEFADSSAKDNTLCAKWEMPDESKGVGLVDAPRGAVLGDTLRGVGGGSSGGG